MNIRAATLLLALGLSSQAAYAGQTVYADRAAFLADTAAVSATGSIPDLGAGVYAATLGSVTLTDPDGAYGFFVGGASYYVGIPGFDWSPLNPGHDIAINHMEHLNVGFSASVYSAGFDFVEPGPLDPDHPYANDSFYSYADSTFDVTLKQGASVVGSFQFNAPDGTLAFVGVWSDSAFDRMEIREISGGIEDEYFGQFYTGSAAPVPEPETYALMLAGLGLVGFAARRNRAC